MQRKCRVSGVEFEIRAEELRLYEQLGVDLPTLCPAERQRRRMAFRNFKELEYRTCSATGQRILSMYRADAPFPVYKNDVWWGDGWDGSAWGRDFDFSRSFFEQYRELAAVVPRFAIANLQSENSQYSNFTLEAKNCFLVFGCVRDEDCLYGHIVWESKNCVDNTYVYRCEWCSNCTDVVGSYNLHYSTECTNCRESYFLHDCHNCSNCFGCFNLRGQSYCIYNEQYSPEAYKAFLKEVLPLKATEAERYFSWLCTVRDRDAFWPEYFGERAEEVSGNHIYGSKNLHECFDAKKSEDSAHCYTVHGIENCLDLCFVGAKSRFCIDSLTVMGCDDTVFSHCVQTASAAYCEFCYSSHDLFGCIGLRNAEFCILNRRYAPRDYAALKARIIDHMRKTGEWGEFFPADLSPFAYNASIAQEYMPLDQAEIGRRGLRFSPSEGAAAGGEGPVPERIDTKAQEILSRTFSCAETGKAFRIIEQELDFYRRMELPLPRICPDARHRARMRLRRERSLRLSTCGRCAKPIHTANGASSTVLCRECYEQRLYGER